MVSIATCIAAQPATGARRGAGKLGAQRSGVSAGSLRAGAGCSDSEPAHATAPVVGVVVSGQLARLAVAVVKNSASRSRGRAEAGNRSDQRTADGECRYAAFIHPDHSHSDRTRRGRHRCGKAGERRVDCDARRRIAYRRRRQTPARGGRKAADCVWSRAKAGTHRGEVARRAAGLTVLQRVSPPPRPRQDASRRSR